MDAVASSCRLASVATKGGGVVKAKADKRTLQVWENPHSDESGPSRRVVIATCLAGKDSGEIAMHFTPKEEKEYNAGMAKLAEMYPD